MADGTRAASMSLDTLTRRPIGLHEALEIAQRLINSHFRQEPSARTSIPALPDYDDDLLILAYIEQRAAERNAHNRRVAELLAANNIEVERRREAERAAILLREDLAAAAQWFREYEKANGFPKTSPPPDCLVPF